MFFSFKQEVSDFVVEEILSFELDNYGDFFYIFFEKEHKNSMDIILSICKHFGLQRKQIGIAGLKDKNGVTKQWLSISKKYLNTCGGREIFLNYLSNYVKILQTGRHTEPLAVGKNKGNLFSIRLRKRERLPLTKKLLIDEKFHTALKYGFPNAYGIQRFGKGNKNYKKVCKMFNGETLNSDEYAVKFMLQSFGSLRFNEYLMRRWETEAILLDGDIMVNGTNAFGTSIASYKDGKLHHFDYWKEKEHHEGQDVWEPPTVGWTSDFNPDIWYPTGPVLGSEQLLCRRETPAGSLDNQILLDSQFLEKGSKISSNYNIYGFRRPLRINPEQLEWAWDEGDLVIKFFLPTGCYASSFLAYILEDIDPSGCISNGLIIPRIPK